MLTKVRLRSRRAGPSKPRLFTKHLEGSLQEAAPRVSAVDTGTTSHPHHPIRQKQSLPLINTVEMIQAMLAYNNAENTRKNSTASTYLATFRMTQAGIEGSTCIVSACQRPLSTPRLQEHSQDQIQPRISCELSRHRAKLSTWFYRSRPDTELHRQSSNTSHDCSPHPWACRIFHTYCRP